MWRWLIKLARIGKPLVKKAKPRKKGKKVKIVRRQVVVRRPPVQRHRYAEVTRKTRLKVLRAIADNPGITVGGLVDVTGIEKPVIRQFLNLWLFAKPPIVKMAKGKRLYITNRGRAYLEKLKAKKAGIGRRKAGHA